MLPSGASHGVLPARGSTSSTAATAGASQPSAQVITANMQQAFATGRTPTATRKSHPVFRGVLELSNGKFAAVHSLKLKDQVGTSHS